MNDPGQELPVGTLVIYQPQIQDTDNAAYVGKQAFVTRYMRSKTRHTPVLLRDCLIRFPSGTTLLVPEGDIVLPD